MSKRTIKDYIDNLEEELTAKIKERDDLVLQLDKASKDILGIVEQQYSLDPTKVKIKCINCRGLGYIVGDDGKKRLCPMCNGERFNWAEIFVKENEKDE